MNTTRLYALLLSLGLCVAVVETQAQPAPELRTVALQLDGIGKHTLRLYTPAPSKTPADRHAKPTPKTQPLIVYFHGGGEALAQGLAQRGLDWPVLNARFPGLSSAYRVPFQNHPGLLRRMLDQTRVHLATNSGSNPETMRFDPVILVSFSAGYGAVREVLADDKAMELVDGLVMVDSMYASYAPDGGAERGEPSASNMVRFRGYAERAVAGDGLFVISHSYLPPGTYAGTHECAADLLRHTGLLNPDGSVRKAARPTRAQAKWLVPQGMTPKRLVMDQGLIVVGTAGTDAQAHLDHLTHADHFVALAVQALERQPER